MGTEHVAGVTALQRACFPPPFDENLLWKPQHLLRHLEIFPEGQFVALDPSGRVVGSASSAIVSGESWARRADWEATLGGYGFDAHDPAGDTLYAADLSVHPDWRRKGVARSLYAARFDLVRRLRLTRLGTACRIPDWSDWARSTGIGDKEMYCGAVVRGFVRDRTLTPLLKLGLRFVCVVENYMEDEESGDAAALLEWTP